MTVFENGYFFEIPTKWLEEHDKQIRADAIAEISREMRVLYGNEYEKQIRAEVIDLIDRHLWNYSHEVWEDFKPILEQLKENNND